MGLLTSHCLFTPRSPLKLILFYSVTYSIASVSSLQPFHLLTRYTMFFSRRNFSHSHNISYYLCAQHCLHYLCLQSWAFPSSSSTYAAHSASPVGVASVPQSQHVPIQTHNFPTRILLQGPCSKITLIPSHSQKPRNHCWYFIFPHFLTFGSFLFTPTYFHLHYHPFTPTHATQLSSSIALESIPRSLSALSSLLWIL